jgi:hypothetical protein
MSRIIDDDPPIKTGVASQAYKDNWDRIFGAKTPTKPDKVEISWPCPCCGWGRSVSEIDCEANYFQCCPDDGLGDSANRRKHNFEDVQ